MNDRDVVFNDLSISSDRFKNIIIPELKKLKPNNKYEIVEGITISEMAKMLDVLAGIDVWQIEKNIGIRGLASRIQEGINFRSFTIRKERESGAITEYEKRKKAIEQDYLYPFFSLQAYISKEERLIDFAIAKTEDILKMIEDGKCNIKTTRDDKVGQASFYVVFWDEIEKEGYDIYIHSKYFTSLTQTSRQTNLTSFLYNPGCEQC